MHVLLKNQQNGWYMLTFLRHDFFLPQYKMFLKYLDAKNVLIFSMFLAVLRLDLNKKITFFIDPYT